MSVQVKGSGTIGGLDEGLVVSGIVTSSTQINVGSNIKLGNAGVVTATSFVGSGANLTSLPAQATIANNADNRVITGGSGVNLNGESTLTYDGSTLTVKGASNTTQAVFSGTGGSGSRGLEIVTETVGATDEGVILNARASGTTGRIKLQTNDKTAITILGNGGDVGIGTESPQSAGLTVLKHGESRLQVWANGDGSNGKIALRADGVNTQIGTWSNHDCHLVRNASIQATISSTGISLPSGKGIDFSAQTPTSATGATTTAEILDHYEEGSWTPVYLNVNTPTYGHRSGTYTRIGRAVHCQFQLSVDSGLDNSDGSAVNIGGLPFTGNSAHESVVFSFGKLTNIMSNARLAEVTNFRFGGNYIMLHRGSNYDINYTLLNSSGHLQAAFTYQMS